MTRWGTGGVASNDFGSFDSSVTSNERAGMDGLRGVIERTIFNKIFAFMGGSHHADKGTLYRKWYKIFLETFYMVVPELPRCSGCSNTSNGNGEITRTTNEAMHIIVEFGVRSATCRQLAE